MIFPRRLHFIIVFIFFSFPWLALASVSMSKSAYLPTEPIVWTTTDSGANRFMDQSCGPLIDGVDNDLNLATNQTEGGCSFGADLGAHFVDECTAEEQGFCDQSSQFFVNHVAFEVVSGFAQEGGSPVSGGSGPVEYRPEVTIFSPKTDAVFSSRAEIKYGASDQNDMVSGQRDQFGLSASPVSLFYSDQVDSWDGRPVPDEYKKLIIRDLPFGGSYFWDTSKIPEGARYRIIADAVDNFGTVGETVSDFFSIDHSLPFFTVKTEPAVSGGENVKITVESSKDLSGPPAVKATQTGFTAVGVDMKGVSKYFEGVYQVVSGYDGVAVVSVLGKDLAGNVSDKIVGGGKFYVNVSPPPSPVVVSPQDKEVFETGAISVRGGVRQDIEAILLVNGLGVYKTKPDENGNFLFSDVKLDPEFNNGVNFLNITARDSLGNESEAVSLSVRFNFRPEINFLKPKAAEVLSGTTTVMVEARDKNNDKLIFSFDASRDNGLSWMSVAESLLKRLFVWDTTRVPDGEYILRVIADDGFATTTAFSGKFTIRNLLPEIVFDSAGKIISNKKEAIISGKVSTSADLKERPTAASLEYSLDNEAWSAVFASDGAFNSFEEKFSLSLANLTEGKYKIWFRAKDSRGFYNSRSQILVVDFGPPLPPEIISPLPAAILGNQDDDNPEAAGIQFSVLGKSEPESLVTVLLDKETYEANANKDGVFSIKALTLKNHGQNSLKIWATDLAGNKSKEILMNVVYNNPPVIKILSPGPERGLSHKAVVRWEVFDPELDAIKGVTLSYRRGGAAYQALAAISDMSKNSFEWDVSRFGEGADYQLRIEAGDGISTSTAISDFSVDNTAPVVSIKPLTEHVFRKSPVINVSGSASDGLSGIEFAEYSIDNGAHWFKALITSGFLGREAKFSVKQKTDLKDGTYFLLFRAVDRAGNVSVPARERISVDSTPPRIGSYTISKGVFVLMPEAGSFRIIRNAVLRFTVSLESDTEEARLSAGAKDFVLNKTKATGLWEAEASFAETGKWPLLVSAKDKAGNVSADKEIGSLEVFKSGAVVSSENGSPVSGAKITIYVKDEKTGEFVLWQAEEYGETNPLAGGENGEYAFLLPAGDYKLEVRAPKFEKLKTTEFTVEESKFINLDFSLAPRKGLRGFLENMAEKIY